MLAGSLGSRPIKLCVVTGQRGLLDGGLLASDSLLVLNELS
jgi:hypothetical protein